MDTFNLQNYVFLREIRMEMERESQKLRLTNEFIKEACILSMKAHDSNKDYLTSKQSSKEVSIIAFKGSMEVDDFYQDDHFGETNVDCDLFPCLQRIGEGQLAKVNASFLQVFQDLLIHSAFKSKVEKAIQKDKMMLFTGHSSGGAIASLATLWVLDEYTRKRRIRLPIGCVTFGSPLIGDETLTHAVRRERWAGHFTHFVMEHDIVPRMMLAPKAPIQQLHEIVKYFQRKVTPLIKMVDNRRKHSLFGKSKMVHKIVDDGSNQVRDFFENVLINASTVASHEASVYMESESSLKEKLLVGFVKVSPYRPFGIYVFCTQGEDLGTLAPRQQLVVENPNAVLQLLFYFLQLPNDDQDLAQFAHQSLSENFGYGEELNNNGMQLGEMVDLRDLNDYLLTSSGTTSVAARTPNKALFELAKSAKLCLLAAEEAEKRKTANMDRIKKSMRKYRSDQKTIQPNIIEDMIDQILEYKEKHGDGKIDYYEAFKLYYKYDDFLANRNRLEQAKVWDPIIEMVMRKDLPDDFEAWGDLVKLATRFRRVYEPLEIANYYRLSRGDNYLGARPKRYKFTQRWYEHANATGFELVSESNFVAKVEDLMKEFVSESTFVAEVGERKKEFIKPKETFKEVNAEVGERKKELIKPKKTFEEVNAEVEERKKKIIKPKKTFEEIKEDFESIKKEVKKWQSDEKIVYEDVYWGDSVLSKLQERVDLGN